MINHAKKLKLVNKNATSHATNHVKKLKLVNKNVTSHATNHAKKLKLVKRHKIAKLKQNAITNTNINTEHQNKFYLA